MPIMTPDRFRQANINQNQCCKNGGDHRFLAGQALEFFNVLHGGSKLRGQNNLFSSSHSSEISFLVLLTPEK